MRVGLVIYGALDQRSGGYLHDRQLVARLQTRGHAVEVLSLPWRGWTRALADNFDDDLERRARGLGLDLLLQDELNHPSLFLRNPRLRARLGCPVVAVVHHLRRDEAWPAWERAVYSAVERRYLRTVDAFACNSQTTRASVERLAGRGLPHVVAFPAGDRLGPPLSVAAIEARALQPGPLRVVFVGNVIVRKRLDLLLDGLARLPAERWRLTVVGGEDAEPAYAAAVRARIARHNLVERVEYRGHLDGEVLAACLAEHDVLAVPSEWEGFGIVYLEGMAFGLPALATTVGAAHEIITPGRDGFLVPPGDAVAIARCLGDLGADRERLRAMGLAARERFLAHPTWTASMDRVVDFLERLEAAR